jgi:TRAP-type transport system small permease protein
MAIFMTWIALAADAMASISFLGFIVAITLQIIYRYLGVSIIFSEELARLLNIYAVFLGAAVATRYDFHIRIDVIDRLFLRHRALAKCFHIFYQTVALLFFVILGTGSFLMVKENWDLPLATMSWLSSGHIYLAPAIASVLMFLITIGKMVELLKGYDK